MSLLLVSSFSFCSNLFIESNSLSFVWALFVHKDKNHILKEKFNPLSSLMQSPTWVKTILLVQCTQIYYEENGGQFYLIPVMLWKKTGLLRHWTSSDWSLSSWPHPPWRLIDSFCKLNNRETVWPEAWYFKPLSRDSFGHLSNLLQKGLTAQL